MKMRETKKDSDIDGWMAKERNLSRKIGEWVSIGCLRGWGEQVDE